jgi:hypothetical protein
VTAYGSIGRQLVGAGIRKFSEPAGRFREAVRPVHTHKFHLGQAVEFNPPRGIYAPRGPYVVTAKLPERDGAFEYRIRSASESHERLARESELQAMSETEGQPDAKIKSKPKGKAKR